MINTFYKRVKVSKLKVKYKKNEKLKQAKIIFTNKL